LTDARAGARRPLRLASARRRGRDVEAPAPEGRRLRRRGLPVRRPPLPDLRQGEPPAERCGARRLRRPELPRHAAERRAPPRLTALPPLRGGRAVPRPTALE